LSLRSRQLLLLGDVMDEGGGFSQRALGDSALQLSRREAQLLASFTRNPGRGSLPTPWRNWPGTTTP